MKYKSYMESRAAEGTAREAYDILSGGAAPEDARRLRDAVEVAAESFDDAVAMSYPALYPVWEPSAYYDADKRLRRGDKLYRVVQAHTSQANWLPEQTSTLYTEIVADADAGTLDNPIPYNGNMALEQGLYYTQDGVVYLCIRDTINPVYNALKDLVGLYVERVTE